MCDTIRYYMVFCLTLALAFGLPVVCLGIHKDSDGSTIEEPSSSSDKNLTEQVEYSHDIESLTCTVIGKANSSGRGSESYTVREKVGGAVVENSYVDDGETLEVRKEDGGGQRIEKLNVMKRDWLGNAVWSVKYRLYVSQPMPTYNVS